MWWLDILINVVVILVSAVLLVKFELAQIVVLIICHVRSYFLKSLNKYEGGGGGMKRHTSNVLRFYSK